MNENKNQKFRRLARLRGERVLRDLHLIGNLANKNNYEYSEAEVSMLFAAIEAEIRVVKLGFTRGNKKKRSIKL